LKNSLLKRLDSTIRQYTWTGIVFVVLLLIFTGFGVYSNNLKTVNGSVETMAELMTDFGPLLKQPYAVTKDGYVDGKKINVSSYAYYEGNYLYVSVPKGNFYEIYRIDPEKLLAKNIVLIAPDGKTPFSDETISPRIGKKFAIDGMVGYAHPFKAGVMSWWLFSGIRTTEVILNTLPCFALIVLVLCLYVYISRIYLVKTKNSLSKDLNYLQTLVEDFARTGEVKLSLAGTESWEIRSLAKILYNISEQMKETQENILQRAGTDELTKLANRRAFEERIEQRISQGGVFSLLFMDLDGFKNINDTLGHEAGDEVLKAVAEKLRKVFRQYDFISRWGGDEFAVLFEGDAEKNLDKIKERINNALGSIETEGGLKVGASVGTSVYPIDGKTKEELMQIADERMYADKIMKKVKA
jgi:diguanylate cyclase (GGDEF)-like protein